VTALLAFDTATEHLSIGLHVDGREWLHEGAGGAQASAALIPAIMSLLEAAGLKVNGLDAIAFGRGPGAFTGLRTAASVAQGLAFGAGRPVIPIDTLLAVAEDAREGDAPRSIWAAMDARMNEIYAAGYRFEQGRWQTLAPPVLHSEASLARQWQAVAPDVVAGNALAVFESLPTGSARRAPDALPRPRALLALALAAWQRGEAVDAALALPLYVRDKVAQTTAERDAARLAKQAQVSPAGAATTP
jgi:tRNA threonylcarbamoyladenosine biosynthesis protein TsaB